MLLYSYFFFVNLIILLLIYLLHLKDNIFLVDRIVLFPGKIIIFKWSYSYISAVPLMAQNQGKHHKHLLFVRGNKFVNSQSSSLTSAVQSVLPFQKPQSGMIRPLKRPLRVWWKEKGWWFYCFHLLISWSVLWSYNEWSRILWQMFFPPIFCHSNVHLAKLTPHYWYTCSLLF